MGRWLRLTRSLRVGVHLSNNLEIDGSKIADAELVRELSKALEPLEPADRPLFLQHLEAEAKRGADITTLRAIRAYKKRASSPTSIPAPETD